MAKVCCVNNEEVELTSRQLAIIQALKRPFQNREDVKTVLETYEPRISPSCMLFQVSEKMSELTQVSQAQAA